MRVRVAALIENSQHEILLIQQKKKDSYYWLLPGGRNRIRRKCGKCPQKRIKRGTFS